MARVLLGGAVLPVDEREDEGTNSRRVWEKGHKVMFLPLKTGNYPSFAVSPQV